jgi:hypothetical protein
LASGSGALRLLKTAALRGPEWGFAQDTLHSGGG